MGVDGDVDATVFRLRGDIYDVQHSKLLEGVLVSISGGPERHLHPAGDQRRGRRGQP
jgi:hypothetical protein